MGWDAERIFAHQIAGPTEPEHTFEYRQQASPLQTTFITGGGGITAYLDDTRNQTVNNLMYQNDKNWGYFEFNPIDQLPNGELVPGTRAQADEALLRLWEDKASYVTPYLRDGGLTGALSPYTIRTRPFEFALQDFIAERQFESPNTRTKRESSFDSRTPIWSMSKASHLEATSGMTNAEFTKGKFNFLTSGTNVTLEFAFAESPTRKIISDEYHAVEFRLSLSSTSASSVGSILWTDENNVEHSINFTPKIGEHVYRINVGGYAPWYGKKSTAFA